MYDVVTIGAVVLDVTVKSGDFRVMKGHEIEGGVGLCEVYGGKTEVEGIAFSVGGGATNSALGFAKKGVRVAAVSKLADDEIGGLIRAKLQKERMDMSLMVEAKKGQSAMSVILVAGDGGRSILTYRGVSKQLKTTEIKWEELKRVKWFYVSSLGGEMNLLEDVIMFAKEEGIKVAWNPGKGELEEKDKMMSLLPYVEVVLLNKMELAGLLGVEYSELVEMGKKVGKLGAKTVVVSDGKKGSVAYESGVMLRAEAFGVKSVDNTGAGDAFGSGFVFGKIKGWELDKCLKAAAASGASVVMRVGAKSGLLTDKDLDKWMGKSLKIIEEKV